MKNLNHKLYLEIQKLSYTPDIIRLLIKNNFEINEIKNISKQLKLKTVKTNNDISYQYIRGIKLNKSLKNKSNYNIEIEFEKPKSK